MHKPYHSKYGVPLHISTIGSVVLSKFLAFWGIEIMANMITELHPP